MNIDKRKFKCKGCGDERPCYVETNQEVNSICDVREDLICILDATNQTSYYWEELTQDT